MKSRGCLEERRPKGLEESLHKQNSKYILMWIFIYAQYAFISLFIYVSEKNSLLILRW